MRNYSNSPQPQNLACRFFEVFWGRMNYVLQVRTNMQDVFFALRPTFIIFVRKKYRNED